MRGEKEVYYSMRNNILGDDCSKELADCWRCGKEIEVYCTKPRVYCPECREEHEKEKKDNTKKYLRLKTIIMHERALTKLEEAYTNMEVLHEASDVVLDAAIKKPSKFQSSHEMMAAIILIANCIHIKTQQNIAHHRVDFVLPEKKVVLEIDGHMHKYSRVKDAKRDKEVRAELGADWEVVRITTRYLEEKPETLPKAITVLKKARQKERAENGGILPYGVSTAQNEAYRKAFQGKGYINNYELEQLDEQAYD